MMRSLQEWNIRLQKRAGLLCLFCRVFVSGQVLITKRIRKIPCFIVKDAIITTVGDNGRICSGNSMKGKCERPRQVKFKFDEI